MVSERQILMIEKLVKLGYFQFGDDGEKYKRAIFEAHMDHLIDDILQVVEMNTPECKYFVREYGGIIITNEEVTKIIERNTRNGLARKF